jgi:hypothetical protein
MAIDCALIRQNRWRQGSVFSTNDGRSILQEPASDARLILVSHDCDIVHAGEREPWVEVCVAKPLVRIDGTYARGKNPRLLHVDIQVTGTTTPFLLAAAGRRLIERSLLQRMIPAEDAVVDAEDLRIIVRWLAKRYERAALPDCFNLRLDPVAGTIRDALRIDGKALSALMIGLRPNAELEDDQPYSVYVVGLCPKELFDDAASHASGLRAVSAVAAAMNRCPGIEVTDFELISEDEFTLHDLRSVVEYSCEDLSLGGDVESPVIPHR